MTILGIVKESTCMLKCKFRGRHETVTVLERRNGDTVVAFKYF